MFGIGGCEEVCSYIFWAQRRGVKITDQERHGRSHLDKKEGMHVSLCIHCCKYL